MKGSKGARFKVLTLKL